MRTHRSWLLVTGVAAIAVYALMWVGFAADWTWLANFDTWALDAAHRVGTAHHGWVVGWNAFCTVFGPTVFRLAVLVVIVIALVRRDLRLAMFLLISVELGGLVTEIAKDLVNRPRPATALVHAASSSFPSGHALGVMLSVAALLVVVLPLMRAEWRGWLVALGVALIVAVGAGRVALNVHHPSDVIAGWALGYAYLVACLLLVPPVRPLTRQDETPAEPGISR